VSITNVLLVIGGAALAVSARRSQRLTAIVGCGCIAAAALVFVHGRAAAAVPQATVTQRELTEAWRGYYERAIARAAEHQRLPDGNGLTKAANIRWFRRARLGVFIHYGPTSRFAASSDSLWWRGIDSGRFDAAARAFRPHPDVVARWTDVARRLGASYITFTAKHHDGFALWNSRLTGWDVGPRADLLRPLARSCRRRHLRLFIYYSLLDRHEPTYATDKAAYTVFVEGQLRELLTEYGPVAGIWFDGWSPSFGVRRLERLYRLIDTLQPWALVGTNHHLRPLPGEDFRIFENRFPRNRVEPTGVPREVAVKLGATWFWGGKAAPTRLERLPALLARAASYRANLLADVPPRPDGTFDASVQGGGGRYSGEKNSSKLPSGS
jgi:Alpha-L-fucosidase